jgi:hypothetical protein
MKLLKYEKAFLKLKLIFNKAFRSHSARNAGLPRQIKNLLTLFTLTACIFYIAGK